MRRRLTEAVNSLNLPRENTMSAYLNTNDNLFALGVSPNRANRQARYIVFDEASGEVWFANVLPRGARLVG